ncbi:MAG: hypothetical protein LBH41_00335 [Rickettsiales bacterium]|jgi:hypothetical protein|nr:hypothetical protein [Rickettsiales bacterium]
MRKYVFALACLVGAQVSAADNQRLFNPNMGIVLNGQYASSEENGLPKGFSIGESELNFNANIDDKLKGSLTFALAEEDGETHVEIEEAFVRTNSLPYGMSVSAGRMMPVFGYLNEKHAHTDDFVFRPLALRSYFDEGRFVADGAQMSVVLPTELYGEVGGGAFGTGDYSAYARIGGGDAHAWRLGASYLRRKERVDANGIIPENDLYGADFKYSYSPDGNAKETELSLYGEYISRQDGDEVVNGYYAALAYKWAVFWKAGYMRSGLDQEAEHALMLERSTSEFGRLRLQYSFGDDDEYRQIALQYTVSMGAHASHGF